MEELEPLAVDAHAECAIKLVNLVCMRLGLRSVFAENVRIRADVCLVANGIKV